MSDEESQEPVAYVVSHGRLADFLLRLSLPVIAWPGRTLFRVVLHGHGFVQEIEGLPPRIGFYVTYFIASRSVRSAETEATKRLKERWENFYADEATGDLVIETEEIDQMQEKFLWRSRWGMAFYSNADDVNDCSRISVPNPPSE